MGRKKVDKPVVLMAFRKIIQQEARDTKRYSKQLYQLVVGEKFRVDGVVGESYATSFTPQSEIVFGGRSRSYDGGFTSQLVLMVTPDNKEIPVRTLNFSGLSVVRAGDHISAQIPRYEKRKNLFQDTFYYLDRLFKPEEAAIELNILSPQGQVLRTDRATNYRDFAKR